MIFGNSYPKIVSGSTTILLEHSTVNFDWNKTINSNENISIMNGNITNTFKSRYAEFEITVNLYKYTGSQAKFNEINALNHKVINAFYLHSDGEPVQSSENLSSEFFVYQITTGKAIEDLNKYDTMTILLKPYKTTEPKYSVLGI